MGLSPFLPCAGRQCLSISVTLIVPSCCPGRIGAVRLSAVGQAVRAIGRCAVTLERAAERCINVLLDLIKQKVNYVVQEAVVVITDIFRRYPNRCSLGKVAQMSGQFSGVGSQHSGQDSFMRL